MPLPGKVLATRPWLSDWSILAGWTGSISHGTYMPKERPDSIDDKDAMVIVVPPPAYYLGLEEFGSRGTVEIKQDEYDIVIYEARKFIRLLSQGNPNVLCLLWLHPGNYLKITPSGQMIIDHRRLFVGRHVYRSFCGYAHGQLHRMTHTAYQGYMGQKRKQLVEKYGFDGKNGSHLIRLLRMGIEFLKDGELYVLRSDAQQLLEIKRGEWTLEQVKQEADRLFRLAEETYLASSLPSEPDKEAIGRLCVEVVQMAHKETEYGA